MKEYQTCYERIPCSFIIDPTVHFWIVANQSKNEIVVFKRDLESGLLTKKYATIGLNSPSSLKMVKY